MLCAGILTDAYMNLQPVIRPAIMHLPGTDHAACFCRRPTLDTLKTMVKEAAGLPCSIPEEALLQETLQAFTRWQASLEACFAHLML